MTTKKALSIGKSLKKDKKYLIKDVKKDKKRKTRRRKRNRNKTKSSSLSDLYTYESPVTNKGNSTNSNFNVQNNVNVVDGLKDFLAIKK